MDKKTRRAQEHFIPKEVRKILHYKKPATPEQIRTVIAWTKLIPDLWPKMRELHITALWYHRNQFAIREVIVRDKSLSATSLTPTPWAKDTP